MSVAALYVDTARGPYVRLPGVDCWGFAAKNGSTDQPDMFAKTRDAREYWGPSPVVAHPPCGPWGRFWCNYKGGEGAKSCAPRAVEQVRAFGGVLEHPSASHLWKHCSLPKPGEPADAFGGWTLEVEQVDWGHPCRKKTWLYIVGVGPERVPERPPPGVPSHVMVRLLRNGNDLPELSKSRRHLTPPAFARWLVRLAQRCTQ